MADLVQQENNNFIIKDSNMKAIGIKMVDLKPMKASEAISLDYRIGAANPIDEGYEVTYQGGYKSWAPKEVVENAYFILDEKNDGTKILREDVEKFITTYDSYKIGHKSCVLNVHTLSGFDIICESSCVSPQNYNEEIGTKYAMEKAVDFIWSHLGFVLQWAKNGITKVHK